VRDLSHNSQKEKTMPFYETIFIARQDLAPSQVETLTQDYSKVLQDNGGSVVNVESWGLRKLAYEIKKNQRGHYVFLNIDAPVKAVHEMERQMRLNENLLRILTVKVDALEEGPSAILRFSKTRSYGGDEREERDDYVVTAESSEAEQA
jgi:small subunit ribosomal protein S6